MTIGACYIINRDIYSINKVTLTARPDDIKINAQPFESIANPAKKTCTVSTLKE